jgi:hypothetical protein
MRTPHWHRRRAEQLEQDVATRGDRILSSGLLLSELATAHRHCAQIIEHRQRTGPVFFLHVDSPPIAP